MSNKMPKCKITVIKREFYPDLVQEYMQNPEKHPGVCETLQEGQEFIVEQPWLVPEGMCQWAWADIRKDILMVMGGGTMPGLKQPGVLISGCTDWFRPVLFRIERID